jgi:predicted permease
MTRLRQDLLYALRSFRKTPGFSIVAVLVIALGIGANTATFSIANELLFRPIAGGAENLVSVHSRRRTPPGDYRLFSYPNYAAIRDAREVFAGVAAYSFAMVALDGDPSGRPRALASVVSANYFETLGVGLAAGRPFTRDEERPGTRMPVAIASYAMWARAGLDPALLGSRLTVNGTDYTIVGVTPEGFSSTMALLAPDVFLPLGVFEAVVSDRFKNDGRGLMDPATEGLSLVGRLAAGRDIAASAPALEALTRQLEAAHPVANRDQALSVYPLSRFAAGPVPQDNTAIATVSGLLLTLSGLVLVIACLNIANMLLARGTARRKELAVRLAIGASRARIVRQLLTESMLLALAGSALGLLLGALATATLAASLTAALPFNLALTATPDPLVLIVTMSLAALATVAFGLGPSLTLSRRSLVVDLKDRGSEGAPSGRWFGTRNLLVVGQVALSLALLTAGGIFTRTAIDSAGRTPGFAYDRLIIATLDTTLAGMDATRGRVAYAELLGRLRAIPGVESVTMASTVPFSDAIDSGRFERVGEAAGEPARARAFRIIGSDYFRTLGLSMVRGREFTIGEESASGAAPVAIVDAAFARQLFGDTDPVGQLIRIAAAADADPTAPAAPGTPGTPMEIVGLAPPLYEELLDKSPAAHVYVPIGRQHRATMHVQARLAPGVDATAALDRVRQEVRAVDPQLPVLALSTHQTFHDRGLELLAIRGSAVVFTGLGVMALVLSVVGVYGLRAYLVAQRTREIGIRMALGAGARDVVRQMVGDGLRLTAMGVGVGVPLAVLVSIGFRSVFVDVGGVDLVVISIATATLSLAALAASAIPARRAARVEPLTALRAE